MIKNKLYEFNQHDLEQIDKQLSKIKNACNELIDFSKKKGGIAVLDRNVERMTAPLKILLGISEVYEILREK